ncbi:hypothetical protein [Actinomyces israelii]|nr:hypothetical protein [Actinomyces israelii]
MVDASHNGGADGGEVRDGSRGLRERRGLRRLSRSLHDVAVGILYLYDGE